MTDAYDEGRIAHDAGISVQANEGTASKDSGEAKGMKQSHLPSLSLNKRKEGVDCFAIGGPWERMLNLNQRERLR